MAKEKKQESVWDLAIIIVQALLIAVVFQTFFYKPYNIPSGSMRPTLLEGDYLFVSKFSYGFSQYSMPFNFPPFEGRIWGADPVRGDILVFKTPRNPDTNYIKRVIGMPGDEVQMIDGALHINGEPVAREEADPIIITDGRGRPFTIRTFVETLDNGVSYTTYKLNDTGLFDNTQVFRVPEGHFFMMGDNRDNSEDSRSLSNIGFVPRDFLVGRAEIIFFSADDTASIVAPWSWPSGIRWERFFSGLN